MESLFGDVLGHVKNIEKGHKEDLKPPCITPSASPPPTPVKARVDEYEDWQKQLNAQWVKPQPMRIRIDIGGTKLEAAAFDRGGE